MNLLTTLTKEINAIPKAVNANSPFLLTITGIIGIGVTVYSAVKQTPLAIDTMDNEIIKRYEDHEIDDMDCCYGTNQEDIKERFDILGPKNIVKTCWKCYVPTVLFGGLTIASFISSYKISTKRLTTMTVAYELTRNMYENYRRNVIKESGVKKDIAARNHMAQEKANDISDETLLALPEGQNICLDLFTGNVFYSTREKILEGVNHIKDKFLSGEQDVSLNEFYDEIDANHIGVGDNLGFTPESNIDILFGSVLRGSTPILTIDYYAAPRFDYRNLM